MHDRPSIQARRADGASIRRIASEFGASNDAVQRAIRPGARDRYWRPSVSEDLEPAVRDVLADDPRASIARVAELVEWPAARRTLADLVERLRPAAFEREREGLNRPRVGAMTVGTMVVGRMKVGKRDGSQEACGQEAGHAAGSPGEVASRAA